MTDVGGLIAFGLFMISIDASRTVAQHVLNALGIQEHSEQEYHPVRRIYFFDPDGLDVERVEYAAATANA